MIITSEPEAREGQAGHLCPGVPAARHPQGAEDEGGAEQQQPGVHGDHEVPGLVFTILISVNLNIKRFRFPMRSSKRGP